MTIRSRLWASLAVALAMALAAGLGVAGPAAAAPDSGDPVVADAPELGAVLNVEYESQPDGSIWTTEYENATVTEFALASCNLTTAAYKPGKVGSTVRGSAYFSISSGCSGSWEVLVSLKLRVSTDYVPIRTARLNYYAPYSATYTAATGCRSGTWQTEVIVQRGKNEQSSRSASRKLTC